MHGDQVDPAINYQAIGGITKQYCTADGNLTSAFEEDPPGFGWNLEL